MLSYGRVGLFDNGRSKVITVPLNTFEFITFKVIFMNRSLALILLLTCFLTIGCSQPKQPPAALESDSPEMAIIRQTAAEIIGKQPEEIATDVPLSKFDPPYTTDDYVELIYVVEERLKITFSLSQIEQFTKARNDALIITRLTLKHLEKLAQRKLDEKRATLQKLSVGTDAATPEE